MSEVKISIMIGPRIGHFSCQRISISSGKNIVDTSIKVFFGDKKDARNLSEFIGQRVHDFSSIVGPGQRLPFLVTFPLSEIDYFTTA